MLVGALGIAPRAASNRVETRYVADPFVMKSRLLNSYEEVTYDRLRAVCEPVGAHVFPEVRVADVFGIQNSGLTDRCFSYALKSHFDFLVTDSDYGPLFSVEFDGPIHLASEEQISRDQLKDMLCEHFHHSLLRINSRYLSEEFRGFDLLTYFVDVWFLEQAFYDAQEKGLVQYDEGFDACFIYSNGEAGARKWPYWLSFDLQIAIRKLYESGRVAQMVPSHYIGVDQRGNYRCISWVDVAPNEVVWVKTGMRAQRFQGVSESNLLSMLAMFDLFEELKRKLRGSSEAVTDKGKFHSELETFRRTYDMRSEITCGALP